MVNAKVHASPTRILTCAKDDYGLLMSLDRESGKCRMSLVADKNWKELHPNIHAPASLRQVHRLAGGGSGATVFKGTHPQLGSLVMKHGSEKETREVFALATIGQELRKRGKGAPEILVDMQARLPDFQALYISPYHLKEKHREMWDKLKEIMYNFRSLECKSHTFAEFIQECNGNGNGNLDGNLNGKATGNLNHKTSGNGKNLCGREEGRNFGRIIKIYQGREDESIVKLQKDCIKIFLREDHVHKHKNNSLSITYGSGRDGYNLLKPLVEELEAQQTKKFWKFTLAQSTIGGPSPRTAASLLTAGLLHGSLLDTLIREIVQVIQNLKHLTMPQEVLGVEEVRKELAKVERNSEMRASEISTSADSFVGRAIRKNFHPERGRLRRLTDVGEKIRSGSLVFTREEEHPAHHLGVLLQPGAVMSDVYANVPPHVLVGPDGVHLGSWRQLLKDAVSLRGDATIKQLWTCGLTDAGLHNLFLSSDRLWLFDLGEPTLEPLPGFLTKFLFSFFHVLGMEEDDSGGWVKRFLPGERLTPTPETDALLSHAYQAFRVTLDGFTEVLFEGEVAVRPLLIKYITLQLLSDASFCLERWSIKGGGQPKLSNHEVRSGLEKWLWRAIWDIYVAFHINTKVWIAPS